MIVGMAVIVVVVAVVVVVVFAIVIDIDIIVIGIVVIDIGTGDELEGRFSLRDARHRSCRWSKSGAVKRGITSRSDDGSTLLHLRRRSWVD